MSLAQPIQPTTQTNNPWRLPCWLRASCGRNMRALRLCHTTSHWRGTTAELHDCCVRVSAARLLVCQYIDRTAWGSTQQYKYQERVVRALLGPAHLDSNRWGLNRDSNRWAPNTLKSATWPQSRLTPGAQAPSWAKVRLSHAPRF